MTYADSPSGNPQRQAAVAFLLDRINYERAAVLPYGERYLKLDRMRTLLRRLGNPDAGMPIVHIAGTKGKGSTSALLASVLHAAGFDVGVYASPHLERIEERFSINGYNCTSDELVAVVDQMRPVVEQMDHEAAATGDDSQRPTFFELSTAAALVHFHRRQVDVAVLEVGLGGRLDSTNVCQPIVTVITSISLDHTRQLGDTVEKIAFEKGGIIKPGVPVVLGPLAEGPQRVLTDLARQRGAPIIQAGRDFRFSYHEPNAATPIGAAGRLDFHSEIGGMRMELQDAVLGLLGGHQAANAAAALAVVAELRQQGRLISVDAMREGLATVRLPGRVETVATRPTVVVDVAHNVASTEALAVCLRDSFAARRRVLIVAVSKDKDADSLLAKLIPMFDHLVVTAFRENPRATAPERLAEMCRNQLADLNRSADEDVIAVCQRPADAWARAMQWAGPDDLVCVTGSFFLAAEMRPLISAGVAASPVEANFSQPGALPGY